MAMAGGPRHNNDAARDEPGARVRMAADACLRPAQHCRALWAVLGTLLLGTVSLLAGDRHTPSPGLCPARAPDA
jgi:hypothetical protein